MWYCPLTLDPNNISVFRRKLNEWAIVPLCSQIELRHLNQWPWKKRGKFLPTGLKKIEETPSFCKFVPKKKNQFHEQSKAHIHSQASKEMSCRLLTTSSYGFGLEGWITLEGTHTYSHIHIHRMNLKEQAIPETRSIVQVKFKVNMLTDDCRSTDRIKTLTNTRGVYRS